MSPIDLARLAALAAIWSASFIFFRIAAPELGVILTAITRVCLAGLVMAFALRLLSRHLGWRTHWREYLASGALNSALPFGLFAFAAQTLPASYSVVLNATSPLFGIIVTAMWVGTRPRPIALAGVVIGLTGVALITRLGPIGVDAAVVRAILACLGASACYALAAVYVQRMVRQPDPYINAAASQVGAALVLMPFLPFGVPPPGSVTLLVVVSILALALVCSGIGYLLYFKLLETVGPTRTLTVTFLQPAFGIAWGAAFLGEEITPLMLAGGALVVLGTALTVRRRSALRAIR